MYPPSACSASHPFQRELGTGNIPIPIDIEHDCFKQWLEERIWNIAGKTSPYVELATTMYPKVVKLRRAQ